jgi:serine/threonine protein kinase
MLYLSTLGISHLDLKPDNIIIHLEERSKKYQGLKIVDFGFSCQTKAGQKVGIKCGTPNYMSP